MKKPGAAGAVLSGNGLKWALVALIDLALLYIVTLMYAQGEIAFALVILLLGGIGTWVFTSEKAYNFRYVYPSLMGVILFVIFPLVYTANVAFTNYGSANLLSFERVKQIHLATRYQSGDEKFTLALYQSGENYQLQLTDKNDSSRSFVSEAFPKSQEELRISASQTLEPSGDKLAMRDVIKMRSALKKLTVVLPDNRELAMTSLREFGAIAPLFTEGENGELINNQTGGVAKPDFETGYYLDENGKRMTPGFTVYVGWDNFNKVLTDPGIQGPFLKIFLWTILFLP